MGGFGGDDAAPAPDAVGDFADEGFLEKGVRLEFIGDRAEQSFVFGGVFLQIVGSDNEVMGVGAVLEGVAAGCSLAGVGFGAGRALGVLAVSGGLLL